MCCLLVLAGVALISGCAPQIKALRSQNEIVPEKMDPKAPLVLAIPGLNVPGAGIGQEQQFGNLVEMLAEQGIPCRVLAYDTPENPLTHVASLGFHDTNIATTRVGPAVVNEIQHEQNRRSEQCLPPLKEVVLFSYSQGGVIANKIALGIFAFKKKYHDFCRDFGVEWTALQKDPEFIYLMNSLEDYLVIRDMKVQREFEFENDPDLRSFYRRARKKLDAQTKEFLLYLKNPREKYPDVQHFEPPESPKYPKLYPKFDACAEQCFKDLHEYGELKQFFVDYAAYKSLLGIHFRFISTAGSYFGSPVANQAYGLFEALPFLQPIAGTGLRQIKDTQLGSYHQTKDAEDLLRWKRHGYYPYADKDTLFILGSNDGGGDGLVDQSAAHLADHALGFAKLRDADAQKERIEIIVDRLPDFTLVPLRVKHFPESNLFGHAYGAAYMEPGSPVFPYLMAFLHKDWETIKTRLAQCDDKLQQFMLEINLAPSSAKSGVSFQRKAVTGNVRIDREYINSSSDTFVWTGKFVGQDQCMNLCSAEDDSGFVTLNLRERNGNQYAMDIPVYPGCNTLIRIER